MDERSNRKLICFGHRGAAAYEPENTLLSVQKAITLGADWIEVDVHAVEGELLVIHDNRLERTTNGAGFLADKSFAYLRTLDAGGGQQIPTLPEVFDLVGRRAGINIELKDPNAVELVSALIDLYVTDSGWTFERILVSSFDHGSLREVKAAQPMVLIGALIDDPTIGDAVFAEELQAHSLHPSMVMVNQALVDDAHQRGLKVYAYTVNDPEDLARMAALGVDGVFTNYPDRVAKSTW